MLGGEGALCTQASLLPDSRETEWDSRGNLGFNFFPDFQLMPTSSYSLRWLNSLSGKKS